MKKLSLLFLFYSLFMTIIHAQQLSDINGKYTFVYNESFHNIIFYPSNKTYQELDVKENIVGEGSFTFKDGFYSVSPTSIKKNATIDIPLKFKIIEVIEKKLKIEVFFPDRKSQVYNLIKK